MLGTGTPITWHWSLALEPRARVWLPGPWWMIGGITSDDPAKYMEQILLSSECINFALNKRIILDYEGKTEDYLNDNKVFFTYIIFQRT